MPRSTARCLAIAALVAGACDDTPRPLHAAADSAHTEERGGALAPALTENDVLAVVDAVNAVDVRMGATAAGRATNAEVRRLGTRLTSAHPQKVTDRPPAIADAGGGAILAPLHDSAGAATNRLQQLSAGPAFDRAYLDAVVAIHEQSSTALGALRGGAASVGDLPTVIARAQADVAAHLAEAKALRAHLP